MNPNLFCIALAIPHFVGYEPWVQWETDKLDSTTINSMSIDENCDRFNNEEIQKFIDTNTLEDSEFFPIISISSYLR